MRHTRASSHQRENWSCVAQDQSMHGKKDQIVKNLNTHNTSKNPEQKKTLNRKSAENTAGGHTDISPTIRNKQRSAAVAKSSSGLYRCDVRAEYYIQNVRRRRTDKVELLVARREGVLWSCMEQQRTSFTRVVSLSATRRRIEGPEAPTIESKRTV